MFRGFRIAATTVVALAAPSRTWAGTSLAEIIGPSPFAFGLASFAIFGGTALFLGFVFVATKLPEQDRRLMAYVPGLSGLLLLFMGACQETADYAQADRRITGSPLFCVDSLDDAPDISAAADIAYDPGQQCVNGKTFYEERHGEMVRVILDSSKRSTARLLTLTPDPYRHDTVVYFRNERFRLSPQDYAVLRDLPKPVCPHDAESMKQANSAAAALRRKMTEFRPDSLKIARRICRPV